MRLDISSLLGCLTQRQNALEAGFSENLVVRRTCHHYIDTPMWALQNANDYHPVRSHVCGTCFRCGRGLASQYTG